MFCFQPLENNFIKTSFLISTGGFKILIFLLSTAGFMTFPLNHRKTIFLKNHFSFNRWFYDFKQLYCFQPLENNFLEEVCDSTAGLKFKK